MSVEPYVLRFTPILKEKVWGGRRLGVWGKALPTNARVGESWEITDLDETSPDGGGGASEISSIKDGPLAGKTIRDAIALWGAAVTGDAGRERFPLLVKLLDARENLSVQAHPVETGPGGAEKTEAWFVLDAAPGARIYAGLKPGVGERELVATAGAGRAEAALERFEAKAGDCVLLPSGTLHALGAGLLVAEVQTPSDVTYRLFDWGREGRALDVEAAAACGARRPAAPRPVRFDGAGEKTLVDCPAFSLGVVRPGLAGVFELEDGRSPAVVLCASGGVAIEWGDTGGDGGLVALGPGETALAPVGVGARLRADSDAGAALVARPR